MKNYWEGTSLVPQVESCISEALCFVVDPWINACRAARLIAHRLLSSRLTPTFFKKKKTQAFLLSRVFLHVVRGSKTLLIFENRHSDSELVKTTETIESLSLLDEVAVEAAALAEMQTQVGDLPTAVDSMEAETAKMAGHIVKRMAVATSEDGGPEGRPRQVDECENTVYEGKTPGCASDVPVGQTGRKQLTLV